MAGDIGYEEQLVVVRPAARRGVAARVAGEVIAAAGVVHQYGDRVMTRATGRGRIRTAHV